MGYEPILDGFEALRDVVLGRVQCRTVLEAVARYTVFLHPKTVEQTRGEALFPIVRRKNSDSRPRGAIVDGVMLDDNRSPTLAFLWAAQRTRGPDVQFNHLYRRSDDPGYYTALWNICVTPAFLAKLTDVKRHDPVRSALKCRSFDLYGYLPSGETEPEPPEGYDGLEWRDHPPPVRRLESELRARLEGAPSSRPTEACREIGWYFSRWEPDDTLPEST